MFCNKCGKELPEESSYCLHCGITLSHINTDSLIKKEGKALISVEFQNNNNSRPLARLNIVNISSKFIHLLQILNIIYSVKIFIDGIKIKELKKGNTALYETDNGKHIVFCEAFGYNRSDAIEIQADSNEIHFNVTFPYMFGFDRKLILTKTLETEAGTWE